jgi:hypothetical protein
VDQLDSKLRDGVPSLAQCKELRVRGPVLFNAKNVFKGKVAVNNKSVEPKALPPGEYRDTTKEL